MIHRRSFLSLLAASLRLAADTKSKLEANDRVDRALAGRDVDRPPFTFWHHFGLKTPEDHARATLAFHQRYRTDLVKVMSDFPYPASQGKNWYDLKPVANPFPNQIEALRLIRDGLGGRIYFIETVFNSWNVAEKLSSPAKLARLKSENPQALLDALSVITKSQIAHIRRAFDTGASGILISVANANAKGLEVSDYEKFSAPFDRQLVQAAAKGKLTVLHLHVEEPYLNHFERSPAPVINYSNVISGIPFSEVRSKFTQVIAGGIDEVNYRKLTSVEIAKQIAAARAQAGPRFMLTPGCSVPNDSSSVELSRLPDALYA